MSYEILTAGTPAELTEKVKAKLAEGYEPLGGLVVFAEARDNPNGRAGVCEVPPIHFQVLGQAIYRPPHWAARNFKVTHYPETKDEDGLAFYPRTVGGTVNSGATAIYPQSRRTIPPESTAG